MLRKYLLIFFVSMVPLIELRGSMVMAVGMDLDYLTALAVSVIGNMLPVPIIYFFARKVLLWGADKKYIGKFFRYCLEKGERGVPGTGAWTGTLAASFLNMGIKSTALSVSLGVIIAGIIMLVGSHTALHVFGF